MDRRITKIPQKAEKVLDAPAIAQTTSYNLIDWVSLTCGPEKVKSDILAVALADEVYFWFVLSDRISDLGKLTFDNKSRQSSAAEEKFIVSAVHWFGGGFLAVGKENASVDIYSFHRCLSADGKIATPPGVIRIHSFFCMESAVNAFAWSRRKKYLICASKSLKGAGCLNGSSRIAVCRFKGSRAVKISALDCNGAEASRLAWDPLGSYVAAGCGDSSVRIYAEARILMSGVEEDEALVVPAAEIAISTGSVKGLAWCPWQSELLAVGSAGEISVFNVGKSSAAGELRVSRKTSAQVGKGVVTGLAFLPRNRELLSSHAGGSKSRLRLWSFPELVVLAQLSGHSRGVVGLAVSGDKTLVASAGRDESVHIWRLGEDEEREKRSKEKTFGLASLGEPNVSSVERPVPLRRIAKWLED